MPHIVASSLLVKDGLFLIASRIISRVLLIFFSVVFSVVSVVVFWVVFWVVSSFLKSPANHRAARKNCKLLITRYMQNCNLLGETKLVPPSKDKNANYLSIKHVYLRVVRGDLLERMGSSNF